MSVRPSGWQAWVEDDGTGRILPADVLSDPRITPSLNTLPNIRLPVPKADLWQRLTGDPEFNVYLDGERQPIDELTRPIDPLSEAATVLEGRGGVELLDVVALEFDGKRRHVAAEELIDTHTTYASDVPTPAFPVLDDEVMQDVPAELSFANAVDIPDDVPLRINGSGEFECAQTGWFGEAEGGSVSAPGWSEVSGFAGSANISDGRAITADANEGNVEFSFTTHHDIPEPENNLVVGIRKQNFDTNQPAYHVEVDGNVIASRSRNVEVAGETSADWETPIISSGELPDPFPAGNHTLTFVPDEDIGGTDDNIYIDAFGVLDTRSGGSFDETTDANDALEGPQLYPDEVEVEFTDATTAFALIRGGVTLTIDDTGKTQRVQLSNDRGTSWVPTDGSEDNTATLSDVDFASAGDSIRMRLRLCGYEPGTTTDTPTQRYDTQTVSAYELTADIEQTSLLLDYSEEQSLQAHLSDIVGDELFWSFRSPDGVDTVSVRQPGATSSDSAPDMIEATTTKDLRTFHEFTVRGANAEANREPFDASTSFVNLNNDRITPGSETVKDPNDLSLEFERGIDYEMEWGRTGANPQGQIRALADGALDTARSDEYQISYRHDVQGTYTDPNAPAGYRSKTVDIPAVTSERNAEQIAFVLVEIDGFNEPRWIADIRVPPGVGDFDVIDALPLDTLDLPAGAGPLEIEEPPEVTPQGTAFRLGTRPELESRLADLRRTTRQVARRSG